MKNDNVIPSITEEVKRINEPIKLLSESMHETSKIFSEMVAESLNGITAFVNEFIKSISRIEFPKIDPEMFKRIKFIMILSKINWPLFLESDKDLIQHIIDQCADYDEKQYPIKQIEEIIFAYCNERFINDTYDFWLKCELVNPKRQPILREALDMHLAGKYYSSTALLICQLYGIIIDISNYVKKKDIIISPEDKEQVTQYFEIQPNQLESEKGKLIQLSLLPDKGAMMWECITEYFQKEILCSSDSKKRWQHQPLRNKICHGEQLNFGTKEHSLKAVLCIDILMKLSDEIFEIVNDNK